MEFIPFISTAGITGIRVRESSWTFRQRGSRGGRFSAMNRRRCNHKTERVVGRDHPFEEAVFSIWAPEHDTASYYGECGRSHHWPAGGPRGRSRRLEYLRAA